MFLFEYLSRICGDSQEDYYILPVFRYDEETDQDVVFENHHYVVDGIMLRFDLRKILDDFPNVSCMFADGDKLVIVEDV